MPTSSYRDEHKWNKAKEISQEKGRGDDYAYIMGIYKRMKPDHFKMKRNGANLQILLDAASKYRKNRNARNLLILRDRLIIIMTVCKLENSDVPQSVHEIIRDVEKDCGKLYLLT